MRKSNVVKDILAARKRITSRGPHEIQFSEVDGHLVTVDDDYLTINGVFGATVVIYRFESGLQPAIIMSAEVLKNEVVSEFLLHHEIGHIQAGHHFRYMDSKTRPSKAMVYLKRLIFGDPIENIADSHAADVIGVDSAIAALDEIITMAHDRLGFFGRREILNRRKYLLTKK